MAVEDLPRGRVGGRVDVLDHGFVRLDAAMADDLSVVNSARVSFGRRHEELEGGDARLIRFLMRHRHGTPFEHNSFRFHVACPLACQRQWQRHRIGSFNELSQRYVAVAPAFYVPALADVRRQVGGPGDYAFEPLPADVGRDVGGILSGAYAAGYAAYERLLEMGVARELARLPLALGLYTEFYWTVNARALMNFLSLRGDGGDAALEMQRYAAACESFLAGLMPETHGAFRECGGVAP